MNQQPTNNDEVVDNGSPLQSESLSFDAISEEEMKEEIGDKPVMFVEVETHVGELSHWPDELEDVCISRTTKRGTQIYIGDIKYNKVTQNISFEIGECLPACAMDFYKGSREIGTTFPDLCWLLSEGTTRENAGESSTKFREDAEFGDLTWLLPAKFCDDLIEAMHIMNNFILEGNLYQAIIYGPKFA